MSIRLPNSKQRIAIIGRTGSGKTIAGLWHLSNASFDRMPWIIIDFKTDEHINAIERATYIDTTDNPTRPGIYILQPHPNDVSVATFLERVWQRENAGVYVDESYMLSEKTANENRFITLLTQGRSKHIPMIVLSQRPVWITRFVWSESDFFQLFHLNSRKDEKNVEDFLPAGSYRNLPEFHSLYYDVGRSQVSYLSPVPDEATLLARIDARLKTIRKVA